MAELATSYMGFALRNPLMVASCSLTKTADGIRRCADAGAGAVVLKSLFEEQILADSRGNEIDTGFLWHPEALDYVKRMGLDTMELAPGLGLSSPQEIALPLRWISLLSGKVKCDFAASTGAHDANGVAKLLLVGATTVQLCSTLYKNGLGQIGTIRTDLERLMEKRGFKSTDQMRGKLSQVKSDKPELYERLQYIKALVGTD